MAHKQLAQVEVKDAAKGTVSAVFSTFNAIDSDGDVTLPGAFEDGAQVRISAHNHSSWMSALPIGKGSIRTTKSEAILDGQFFMDTTDGRDTFTTVKELGSLQEWSYGYDVVGASYGEFEGQEVRFLNSLKVHEVSPVLLGAGVNTRTLSVKGQGHERSLAEETAEILDGVSALLDGAARVAAIRAEKGKPLSKVNQDLLALLEEQLGRLKTLLAPEDEVPPFNEDAARELARSLLLSLEGATRS